MAIVFPLPPTKEQSVAAQLDTQVRQLASAQKTIYTRIFKLIYQNSNFTDEYGTPDPSAVYDAFLAYTKIYMTDVELDELLRLTKTSLNWLEPSTILDDVIDITLIF